MYIFSLEIENDDFDNAEFVSAPERSIEFERHLESWLENNPWTLVQGEDILWIGKRTSARVEDSTIFPDLIGIDAEGNLVVIELKRGRTPRDTVAQLLDYAAWADGLSESKIYEIAEGYLGTSDGLEGKTFSDTFREVFLTRETDEIPPLNRNLRLFIVAGRISERVLKVCRFLRTSHEMDVSCIAVSMFQTESGDAIVGMETKLGDENRVVLNPAQVIGVPSSTLKWEVVWAVIQQLTDGNPTGEFITEKVKETVLGQDPNFNERTISGGIHSFRRSSQVVFEAIQGLRNENTDVELTKENIIAAVLEEHPGSIQARIRKMIDLFYQSEIMQTQLNQIESVVEDTA